jgi:hypothetical protein
LFKKKMMTGGTSSNAKVNRIEPPGVVSKETIDEIIARLDETLTEVAHKFSLNAGPSPPGDLRRPAKVKDPDWLAETRGLFADGCINR